MLRQLLHLFVGLQAMTEAPLLTAAWSEPMNRRHGRDRGNRTVSGVSKQYDCDLNLAMRRISDARMFQTHYEAAEHINAGTGEDLSIRELAEIIREIVHSAVRIVFDASKPDGARKKLLDVSRMRTLGWWHSVQLRDGVTSTDDWFRRVEAARLDRSGQEHQRALVAAHP